ncbi:MAG: 1,4-alpha-glucan branching protein GlgB [Chloroflexota bacterium]
MKMLTEFDLHLFGQGTHRRAYEKLGAHCMREGNADGVRFAVWAPSATGVSVIGDFNAWRHGTDWLHPTGVSGIWQGFVAHVRPGALYKFSIVPPGGNGTLEKADPFAFQAEVRPHTASVVTCDPDYAWGDDSWMRRRGETQWSSQPVSVYEVHLGSWRRSPDHPSEFLSYRHLADHLPEYARDLGYTHVELMPVAEHPLDMSWGYQTTGYFAPTARFGSPEDFMYLVDRCHRAGLGVILDWVPAHFPKDAHGLAFFDGTHLYEHADPRQGEQLDWGTLVFNYGRNEVKSFLLSNAVFWIDRYHIDGLRVDAVASMLYLDYSRESGGWIPNRYGGRENLEAIEFIKQVNWALHEEYPGALMIAEESTAWPGVTTPVDQGGLGFDFKWNMGWMHDTLEYMALDPVYRHFHHNEITFSLVYAFTERFMLPLSHDEIVHGKRSLLDKMPGDAWQKFANLRLLLAYMWTHPGKKLLFMGSEFGQWREWDHDSSLDWHLLDLPRNDGARHQGMQRLVRDLNGLLRARPALYELDERPEGFEWIDYQDADNSVLVFRRVSRGGEDDVIVVCNFTPVVRHAYRIGLPKDGPYLEILNTDAEEYGGSGVRPALSIQAENVAWHGRPYSCEVTLPPLAVFVLSRR